MNKKITIIVSSIIGFILLILANDYLKNNNGDLTKKHNKDSSYYLTSPWVTESIDWYYFRLPEKWQENKKELKKNKDKYKEISNEVHMYELYLKDFNLMCMYMDVKDGIFENWNLDKSAEATISQILYNLDCEVLSIEKQSPIDNPLEVNYIASSSCNPINFKAKLKGVRFENHVLLLSVYYNENDPNLEEIADRILNSFENKYQYIPTK